MKFCQHQIVPSLGFDRMNLLLTVRTAKFPHGKRKLMQIVTSKFCPFSRQVLVEFFVNYFYLNEISRPKFSAVDSDYPDTAVINICSNIEYNPSVPIVYTSSTHLNIVGHRFDDDDDDESDIFSKYSTLPIGMFALRACPHDPNKYALFWFTFCFILLIK